MDPLFIYTECTAHLIRLTMSRVRTMYFGALLLLIIGVACVGAISENILINRNECIDYLELDEDVHPKTKEDTTSSELDDLLNFDPNDFESLALWKCIMKKEKVINSKGQYQMDALKKWLPDDVDSTGFEKCMTIKNDDACDALHFVNKCVVEQMNTEEEEEKEGS